MQKSFSRYMVSTTSCISSICSVPALRHGSQTATEFRHQGQWETLQCWRLRVRVRGHNVRTGSPCGTRCDTSRMLGCCTLLQSPPPNSSLSVEACMELNCLRHLVIFPFSCDCAISAKGFEGYIGILKTTMILF